MENYYGQVILVGFNHNHVPNGYLPCNGQILSVQQYQALYSLIGNTWGGQPGVNFALPNLQGKSPDPNLYYLMCCSEGVYPMPQ